MFCVFFFPHFKVKKKKKNQQNAIHLPLPSKTKQFIQWIYGGQMHVYTHSTGPTLSKSRLQTSLLCLLVHTHTSPYILIQPLCNTYVHTHISVQLTISIDTHIKTSRHLVMLATYALKNKWKSILWYIWTLQYWQLCLRKYNLLQ